MKIRVISIASMLMTLTCLNLHAQERPSAPADEVAEMEEDDNGDGLSEEPADTAVKTDEATCDFKAALKACIADVLKKNNVKEEDANKIIEDMSAKKHLFMKTAKGLLGLPDDAKKVDILKKMLGKVGVTEIDDAKLEKFMATVKGLRCEVMNKMKEMKVEEKAPVEEMPPKI